MPKYKVFHRKWWKYNPNFPDKREPHLGKEYFICWADSYESARDICRVWNANHKPGKYSDKAEFYQV